MLLYRIKEALSRFYYKHHKEVYTCYNCGLMIAPYLENEYNSLTYDLGFVKKKNPKRWYCHHCECHQGEWSSFSPEELEADVKRRNAVLKERIAANKTNKRLMTRKEIIWID